MFHLWCFTVQDTRFRYVCQALAAQRGAAVCGSSWARSYSCKKGARLYGMDVVIFILLCHCEPLRAERSDECFSRSAVEAWAKQSPVTSCHCKERSSLLVIGGLLQSQRTLLRNDISAHRFSRSQLRRTTMSHPGMYCSFGV
jgi:hypothetical protein